jgi:hypothetical protein
MAPWGLVSVPPRERYPDSVHRWPRPRRHRLRSLPKRIARFVRALFGGRGSGSNWDDAEGGVGVREPRRPLSPTLSGAAAVELPDDDDSP